LEEQKQDKNKILKIVHGMGKRVRAKINNFVGVKTRTPARAELQINKKEQEKRQRIRITVTQ